SNFVCNDSIDDEYTGYEAMLEGNISTFIDMILNYYKAKSLREFREYNEVAFQTAVELLLPTKHWCSELRLIVDSSKISGEGLLSGEEGRWIDNPDYRSLMALDAKLEEETENELLNRNYFYWRKETKKCKRVNVKKIISDGVKQLNRYMLTMQNGKVNNQKVSGVCDDKIKIEKGEGFLG
ncbi:15538_t:CDS:2, partial [Racocetra fulgida]